MYIACANIGNSHAVPDKIQQIDAGKFTSEFLEDCYMRVKKQYERLAEKHKGTDEERDYDGVSKGPQLLAALTTELRRRFNRKSKSKTAS